VIPALFRRKSRTFATLGWGIEHEIEGIWWSFATLEKDFKNRGKKKVKNVLTLDMSYGIL